MLCSKIATHTFLKRISRETKMETYTISPMIVLENAKSARSKCKGCKDTIMEGGLRVSVKVRDCEVVSHTCAKTMCVCSIFK